MMLARRTGCGTQLIKSDFTSQKESVRKWLKRYEAEGIEGLKDEPRPGVAPTVTPDYQAKLVATVRGFSIGLCNQSKFRPKIAR